LTGGVAVKRFEDSLSETCASEATVAVSNGTAALHIALTALGIKRGDEVITTPLTFVASANAALYLGAKPVFVEVGSDRCLDVAAVAAAVTDKTRAIVSVDYAGLPSDILGLRTRLPREIPIVADAAHSLGGRLGAHPVGELATITTLSFHPAKVVATGEGGACVTNDLDLAAHMRRLRNHGMTTTAAERSEVAWQYDVTELGYNYRLTDVMAALGTSQLTQLQERISWRRELADRYDDLLQGLPGIHLPPREPDRDHAWHLYVIELDETFGWGRDEVIDALRAERIGATLHYPAVHLLELFRNLGYRPGLAPKTEKLCTRLITLPLFFGMTSGDQDDVVAALQRLYDWRNGRVH